MTPVLRDTPGATIITVPVLETERLRLRAHRAGDHPRVADYMADEGARFTGGEGDAVDAWRRMSAQAGTWALLGFGMWAIADKASDLYLGVAGGHRPVDWPEREIGYWLHPDARGRGIAFEAVTAARDWLYAHAGWTTAVSYIDPLNQASRALAEQLGAVHENTITLRDEPAVVYRHPAPGALAAWHADLQKGAAE